MTIPFKVPAERDPSDGGSDLLVSRIRTGLLLMLSATVLFAVADLISRQGRLVHVHAVQLAQIAIIAIVLRFLSKPWTRERVAHISLISLAVYGVTIAVNGVLRQDIVTPALLTSVLAMGAATLIPWTVRAQLFAVMVMALAVLWNVFQVTGGFAAVVSYPALGTIVALGSSVYIASEFGRLRLFATNSEQQRRRVETVLTRQRNVLEMIVKGTPLSRVLESLVRAVEEAAPDMRCSVLLLDEEEQCLRHGVAPSLPETYNRAVDGLSIGPMEGSCGTAAYLGERVVSTDISTDPRWERFRDLALACGLCACWSAPMRAADGRVLGTFAMYYGEPCSPTIEEIELIEIASHIGGIAIERKHGEQRQQEEAQIAAALAKVGEVLISSLDRPVLLDRLCQVTAEVLGCHLSHTLLWQPREKTYRVAAEFGGNAEQQEEARLVKIPLEAMTGLMERLERDDVAHVGTVPEAMLRSLPGKRLPVSLQLCIALRRGSEVIGVQVVSSASKAKAFSAIERRIARGISQLASLALQNARLVEELEQASRLKSQFVSTMSHELRTPLNVIIGYNGLLLEGTFGELTGRQLEPIQRVDQNARQLLELINDTLNLGRLEAGRIQVEPETFDVEPLIAEIEEEARPLLEAKDDLALVWRVDAAAASIRTDRTKLKVILKNLVGNAIKFTDRGRVSMKVEALDGGIQFSVADTGAGIPHGAIPIIFEAFRQVDGTTTRRHGGVGLGLHIVRSLLELLGGRIQVESEVGRGSDFQVWLPRAIGPEDLARAGTVRTAA